MLSAFCDRDSEASAGLGPGSVGRCCIFVPNKHYSDYRIEILTSRIESNVSGADEDYRSVAA
jgi:hypothetical protein